jgi:hypothetical protein
MVMLIETTLHINKRILEMINEYAEKTNISRASIIKLLIHKVMHNNRSMIKTYSRIQYQARDMKENWYRIHIVLNEYEYEYYLDMRKFFKMSVSFILAYAVLKYLDELIKQNISNDKYCYINYILIKETLDNVILWKIYWGVPQKLPSLPYL